MVSGAGHPAPGSGTYFARLPRVLLRAVARARLEPCARAVLDELLGSVLGPDERYRRDGVPFAVRVFAERAGLAKSSVDRGVRDLLDRGLIVRLADPARRNAYRYQVMHPAWWPGEE